MRGNTIADEMPASTATKSIEVKEYKPDGRGPVREGKYANVPRRHALKNGGRAGVIRQCSAELAKPGDNDPRRKVCKRCARILRG